MLDKPIERLRALAIMDRICMSVKMGFGYPQWVAEALVTDFDGKKRRIVCEDMDIGLLLSRVAEELSDVLTHPLVNVSLAGGPGGKDGESPSAPVQPLPSSGHLAKRRVCSKCGGKLRMPRLTYPDADHEGVLVPVTSLPGGGVRITEHAICTVCGRWEIDEVTRRAEVES